VAPHGEEGFEVTASDVFVIVENIRGEISEISFILLAAGRKLVEKSGGTLSAVLLGHQVQAAANGLGADRVLFCDQQALKDFNPELHQRVIADAIRKYQPGLVLFGDTSTGADIAGNLSVRLGLPLISSCRKLEIQDGKTIFSSQICGGKIIVEGEVPGPTAIVAMIPGEVKAEEVEASGQPALEELPFPDPSGLRMSVKGYIEPAEEDIDITKEPIVVAVGRGIQNQDNLAFAEELAEALGGVVAASRPIIDQGWLPTSRLVGKSGKKVKPKVYLALGISGAPEHVESINGSEVILAVNTDPTAPIFGIANYGTTVDLLDLAPVLTERLVQAKAS
jgi:electron transfer flavoprotein alpha subunit